MIGFSTMKPIRVQNFCVVALLIIMSGNLTSQTKVQIPLIIDCIANDAIGKSLCRAVRDEVARSPRYAEVSDNDANWLTAGELHVNSTAAVGSLEDDNIAAVATVFTKGGRYYASNVMGCGRTRIADCARGIVDDLDGAFSGK
jgi:hypothetical protein